MGWYKTSGKKARNINSRGEALLSVQRSHLGTDCFFIYDLTGLLSVNKSPDRLRYMGDKRYTIRGNNGVIVHILDYDSDLSYEQAKVVARRWWHGNTFTYRLD